MSNRLIKILDILNTQTDENHLISTPQIISKLAEHDIKAERKAIYRDIDTLIDNGVDIVKNGRAGYYIASREFELPEILMLIDAVQAARFITPKKTSEMIKKLQNFVSRYQAKEFKKLIFLKNDLKNENEQIYYNIDKLYKGIMNKKKMQFKYTTYNLKKEQEYARDGQYYTVSPFAMTWQDNAYYLICSYKNYESFTHFRIDRMKDVQMTNETANDYRDFSGYSNKYELSDYVKKSFSMMSGDEETVEIIFPNKLITSVVDRFGKDASTIPINEDKFLLRVKAIANIGLMAWLFHFGDTVEIIKPLSFRKKFMQTISKLNDIYYENTEDNNNTDKEK